MSHPEESTIKAINELRGNYPYAAALLIYVVIERELKEYILNNTKTQQETVFHMKQQKIGSTLRRNGKEFKDEVWDDRNDLIHSNPYRKGENKLLKPDRHLKNVSYFGKALDHLKWVFRDFSTHDILGENSSEIILRLKTPGA